MIELANIHMVVFAERSSRESEFLPIVVEENCSTYISVTVAATSTAEVPYHLSEEHIHLGWAMNIVAVGESLEATSGDTLS